MRKDNRKERKGQGEWERNVKGSSLGKRRGLYVIWRKREDEAGREGMSGMEGYEGYEEERWRRGRGIMI